LPLFWWIVISVLDLRCVFMCVFFLTKIMGGGESWRKEWMGARTLLLGCCFCR
jgi:hypothetical protein